MNFAKVKRTRHSSCLTHNLNFKWTRAILYLGTCHMIFCLIVYFLCNFTQFCLNHWQNKILAQVLKCGCSAREVLNDSYILSSDYIAINIYFMISPPWAIHWYGPRCNTSWYLALGEIIAREKLSFSMRFGPGGQVQI